MGMKVEVQTPRLKPDKSRVSKPKAERLRRLPIGAEPSPTGGTHFRVWAPNSASVKVQLADSAQDQKFREYDLAAEPGGYFSGLVKEAQTGMLYKYGLDSGVFPDPASRFQPDGPHGPSQIVGPSSFQWSDQRWPGVKRSGHVIYELHIGTFTGAGTWAAAQEQLQELADLGISMIEVMPVAEFPGRFGWGYDGVDLFAPTRLYGQPDDFRRFVDQAHAVGLAVILDVVYNHFGPDGNFLKNFSQDYFTSRYKNEWGEPINFDGDNCGPVREFFCANAAYWIDEFHLDGLRLDATQQIFDCSAENIHTSLSRHARRAAGARTIFIVAENESQNSTLARSVEQGGYGLDALWNDDFHHAAMVALSGRAEAYYSDFKGTPQEFISAVKRGFLYQGQRSSWQKQPRGTISFDLAPEQFVNYLQNHDQIANSLSGLRAHQLAAPGCLRALTALLLLGPATPMLFQGQEFAASAPFLFFADHNPELAKLVAQGRKAFLSQFGGAANPESHQYLTSPETLEAFSRCKLDFSERVKNRAVYQLHRDLLRLRREDPVFSKPRAGQLDGAVLTADAFVLRFFAPDGVDRLLLINLGTDTLLASLSEPLLANAAEANWSLTWSSEAPAYGGAGTPPLFLESGWHLPGHAAFVLAASAQGQPNSSPEA